MGLADAKDCPGCGSNLDGEPIPEELLHCYNRGPDGELIHSEEEYAAVRDQIENETTHYSRVIGVEYQGRYDGISEWVCPDCGRREGRWSGKVLGEGETEERYGGRP
jgi:hypothetical protein